jgi:hypothetical protein
VSHGWSLAYLIAVVLWIAGRPGSAAWFEMARIRVPRLVSEASAELHPFMPFAILTNLAVITWGDPIGERWTNYAFSVVAIAGWFADKDNDDRWKRRRKRLGDRVKSLGHRLVTASDGAA